MNEENTEGEVPDAICAVDGCGEPAVMDSRAPVSPEGVDAPDGELVPLCATHAEQADEPEVIAEG